MNLLFIKHAVECAPSELRTFHARRHVGDILELSSFVKVFIVFFGELVAADHGEEQAG